jgi:hypothetical protein
VTDSVHGRPVVYGEPEQVVLLVDSLTRIVDHQPEEILADPEVNGALRQLGVRLAGWCQADAPGPDSDQRAS